MFSIKDCRFTKNLDIVCPQSKRHLIWSSAGSQWTLHMMTTLTLNSECIVCIHVARLYLCLVLGLGPGVGRGVLTWLMSSMLARGALTLLSQLAIMPARLVLLMMMNLSGFQVVQQRSVVGVEHVYWHS